MKKWLVVLLAWVVAMTAVLKITDGTTEIDLLGSYGYVLNNWRPQTADYKGGGVWKSSSIAQGRRLADKKWTNAIETFELKATRATQDALIRETQGLRRMLEDTADYWVNNFNNTPVYIETKATDETNTRYAVVHRGRIAEDDNPFSQPFLQADCSAAMDRLTLVVERGHWGEEKPGTGTCVELSGEQEWEYTQTIVTSQPAQAEDDGFAVVHPWAPVMDWNSNSVRFGAEAASWDDHGGLRFPNLAVPQGAEVLSAYITFEAWASDATNWCKIVIFGEDADNAAIFSSFQDFMDRPKTDAFVNYPTESSVGIESWVVDNFYDTPELRSIIQEIVDRTGWSTGNALVIFLLNDDSTTAHQRRATAWEDRPDQATLTVNYVTKQAVGRTATCEQEVYAANKHNIAQLSHVWRYSAGGTSYTDLMGLVVPYDLLPNPVITGDIIYFGIDTALENSGPFASLVFDIGTRAIYTGNAGIAWEYYDGVWQTLNVQDNTRASLGGGVGPFSVTDVNSVHWEQPNDWIPLDVNGITAYWVRARVVLGTGTITVPTQQNRNIYTICWAYLDIDEAQVPGDIEALSRLKLFNESDYRSGAPNLWANRVIVGRRAISRGEDFRAYINLADEQNHPGLEINAVSAAAAFQTDTTAPAGRNILYTPTGVSDAWGTRASIYFKDEDLIQQYRGVYRAFVRAKQTGGDLPDDYVSVRLGTQMPGDNIQAITDEIRFTKVAYIQALDLGEISIPLDGSPSGIDFEWYFATNFHIQANSSAAWSAATLTLYDFILIPADEWLGEFVDPTDFIDFGSALGTAGVGNMRLADIDSISHPKRHISALVYQESTPDQSVRRALLNWQERAQGSIALKENADQRFWIFADQHATLSDDPFVSPPYHGYSAQAFRNAQYLSMRGDR